MRPFYKLFVLVSTGIRLFSTGFPPVFNNRFCKLKFRSLQTLLTRTLKIEQQKRFFGLFCC
jgi:hypothetical protein